ncbi:hypothetical protein TTHERM_000312129 (macronuclear) [Tetrahymena thermophila SB210]|uniref:Uncharacterized protein n=1 Tax=Tetrahymena thermophila (strain SB210) TaxID=312017 RepID=W7XGW3_TETTS|nr:hypothetical protein TTHERM_000312129 [Tetrahymena thermophila SB210]EWS72234.1 hypothetical protein TTHERM_000312129 [Tetrahymena thermophila SB210]|eukprot:XP_012655174.1 hypothetical protein TTHERM_000312129 [Tetrahymena thermophila SB210]
MAIKQLEAQLLEFKSKISVYQQKRGIRQGQRISQKILILFQCQQIQISFYQSYKTNFHFRRRKKLELDL